MTTTDAGGGLGRASALLASGTIVSRLLGFVSAAVLAQAIGTVGAGADTFAIANQLPNNIYAIIAGGLLSAVLVPQIVRAGLHDDGGARFINRLVTLGLTVFVIVAIAATVAAPWLVALYSHRSVDGGPGLSGDDIALATAFAYWCLPQVLFYAIYSLLGEVLNARRIFGPFTWTPVLNNLVAIAGMIVFIVLFGAEPSPHRDASSWTPAMVAILAGTATLGIAVQGIGLFFFWRRAGLTYRPDFHWRGVGLGSTGKAAAWVFGMILVTQLAGIVQTNVASTASGEGPSVRALSVSWLIFMLPHSIVAVSIATAYFTRMSTHARDGDLGAVRRDLSASLRSIGLIMVFAAVGLVVLAYPFSAVFNSHFTGKSTFGDVQGMAFVVMAYLVGLVPFSILFVLQRTFYSLDNTRTPFFLQVFQSVLFVIGALVVSTFSTQWIAVGIAGVTAIAGSAQAVAAAWALRRRIGSIDATRILRQHAVFLLAALPAAAVGVALLLALGGTHRGGFAVANPASAVVSMAVIGGAMAVVYFGALILGRNPELGEIVRPLIARLRRVASRK